MRDKLENFYLRSSIFSILALVGAVLNYALYPVIARILPPEEFGNFTAITALANQTLGVLLAFNLISIYLVKNYDEAEARKKAQSIQRLLIWLFLLLSCAVLIASPFIGTTLKIFQPTAFLILTSILLISIPGVVWSGYLQGHKKLIQVGLFSTSASLMKLIFAVLFASIFGYVGGLFGVFMGTMVGLLVLKVTSGVQLPSILSIFSRFSLSELSFLKTVRLYIVQSVIVVGGLGLLQNIDITFAKYLFSPEVGGVYSGISILSNAAYYGCFLLVWILLPEIDLKNPSHNRQLLRTAYKLLGVLAVLAVLAVLLFKNVLVEILLGARFSSLENVFIYAILFQLSLVAVTLYAYYLLVIRSRKSIFLAICIILPCLTTPVIFGDSPQNMIVALWLSVVGGFGFYSVITLLLKMMNKRLYVRQ